MRFALPLLWIGLMGLVGCSSAPKPTAELAAIDSRSEYITQVSDSLDKWHDRAQNTSGEKGAQMRAAVADARTELAGLQAAPSSNWLLHKDAIDSRMSKIQDIYNRGIPAE